MCRLKFAVDLDFLVLMILVICFQFYRDFEEDCNKVRDVKFSKELNSELKTFDQWLAEKGKLIPLD